MARKKSARKAKSVKMTVRRIKGFGWRPDLPDHRDYRLKLVKPRRLPTSFRLTANMPDIFDQGQLGSCVGNAVAAALQFDRRVQKLTDFPLSRLMIYWDARSIEGTTSQDAGCEIRDAIKSVAKLGAANEALWPYNISKFAKKPPAAAYKQGLETQAIEYLAVDQTADAIRAALFAGYPVVFGFACYESLESDAVAKSGNLPMPKKGEAVIGGHAVVCVGWDTKGRWVVRNSWGTGWGQKGYFTMPQQYLLDNNLSDDFWVVRSVG
jgi:C1A family cysteine protease